MSPTFFSSVLLALFLAAFAAACAAPLAGNEGGNGAGDETADTAETSGSELRAVAPSRFCVTDGRVDARSDGRLAVDVGGMRGVVAGDRSKTAEVAFTYPGPSSSVSPLASGEVRTQVGLKLRAQDSCNLVYVMWRIAPEPGIVVQVKRNAGKSEHEQCGNGGYAVIDAEETAAPGAIARGESHTLRAELEGRSLRVIADGKLAWRGVLPEVALEFDGPAGVRTDNAQVDFELRVPGGATGRACAVGRAAL